MRVFRALPIALSLRLGCIINTFLKLIEKMNYQILEKNNETYFKYLPQKKFKKNYQFRNDKKDNPFKILKQINFK